MAVDDCGRILNPVLVRGQQHGGLGQGIAQALFEEVRYDEGGNPVTSTLATYQMPSAADLPSFEVSNTETPTHLNPLGVKGIGEPPIVPTLAALAAAVQDATGAWICDLPLTPERIYFALHRQRFNAADGNGSGNGHAHLASGHAQPIAAEEGREEVRVG